MSRGSAIQRLGESRCPQVAVFSIVNITETHETRSLPGPPISSLRTDFTKSSREMLRRSPTTISLTQDDITRYDESRKQKLEAQHIAQEPGSSLENLGAGSRGAN